MRELLRLVVRVVLGLLIDLEVRDAYTVPTTGGFVMATNHLGILDIIIPYYVYDRPDMFIMVAEKWGQHGWIRFIARQFNFLFIDRFNPDIHALREVITRMKNGQVLIIAPEGTRSRTGALIEGKPGVSYLASKLGYPIYPVALTGTEDENVLGSLRHFRKPHVTARAGTPFELPKLPAAGRDEALQRYTDEIMCQIAAMLPEKYWGVYANHPRLKELLAGQK